MAATVSYWLMKSDPESFSIRHLAKSPKTTTCWSGVRNYQARNFMRAMKVGDRVLFFHSSTDSPSVVGTAVVVRAVYPDHTALDPKDDHYDPKASRANPIWEMVDIRLDEIFDAQVPIGALRGVRELAGMELLRTGSRLSVQPVRPREFSVILDLAKSATPKSSSRKPAGKPRRAATAKKGVSRAK